MALFVAAVDVFYRSSHSVIVLGGWSVTVKECWSRAYVSETSIALLSGGGCHVRPVWNDHLSANHSVASSLETIASRIKLRLYDMLISQSGINVMHW